MLKLEKLEQDYKFKDGDQVFHLYRAKIPGGWLVLMRQFDTYMSGAGSYAWGYGGATFVPDPNHGWDGSSID